MTTPKLNPNATVPDTSCSISWYAEGEGCTVIVNGVQVSMRFVGRKGGRGRILIEAPAGAVFNSVGRRSNSVVK